MAELFEVSPLCFSMTTLANLQIDHIVDILLRLPVKTLFRCVVVCKSFRAIIKSKDFIDLKNQATVGEDYILIYQCPRMRSYHRDPRIYFSLFDQTFTENKDVKFPIHTDTVPGMIVPVGCCRGLLCLVDPLKIYLWNPALSLCKTLDIRDRKSTTYRTYPSVFVGYGYESRTKDFKIVQIKRDGSTVGKISREVDVYTLNSNSWRSIGNTVCGTFDGYPTAVVNGIVHWDIKVMSKGNQVLYHYILCFSLDDELFHEISLPDNYPAIKVKEYRGLLSITCHRDNFCDVWVMKDYGKADSWSKLFTYEDVSYSLWLLNMEYELLLGLQRGKFAVCDEKSGQVTKEFQPKKSTDLADVDYVHTIVLNYKESLVLLNQHQNPLR